ncbi:MAG: hypothetical protein KME06_07515 [Kastovskya adunca ATA6-11-RM4]|jgi:hypothetical protein|nr:hypothetical protein [Kastovskya adunca ATA6-11-RM4]
MKLTIENEILKIEWEEIEQFWAFNFTNPFKIPLAHILNITTDEPPSSWQEIRAPGTFLPGIIKAGTYYTPRGREFWYVVKDRDYLVLELQEEPFKKIVLTLEGNQSWKNRIMQLKNSSEFN